MPVTLEPDVTTTAPSSDVVEPHKERSESRTTAPTNHPLHLPYSATFWSFMILGAFAAWTHYAGGPMLYHLIVGGVFLYSVALLLAMESKPNTIGKGEIICSVFILITGGLLFSSPAIQPYVQQGLREAHIFPSKKLEDGPDHQMYRVEKGSIYPTKQVQDEFLLVIEFDGERHPVTTKGVKIDRKEAEIWLQHRATGATSNSIPVRYEDDTSATSAAKPDAVTDTSSTPAEKDSSVPPKTDPPPADTGTKEPIDPKT